MALNLLDGGKQIRWVLLWVGSSSLAHEQKLLSLCSQALAGQVDSDRKVSLVVPESTQQPSTSLHLNYKIPVSAWYATTKEAQQFHPQEVPLP